MLKQVFRKRETGLALVFKTYNHDSSRPSLLDDRAVFCDSTVPPTHLWTFLGLTLVSCLQEVCADFQY